MPTRIVSGEDVQEFPAGTENPRFRGAADGVSISPVKMLLLLLAATLSAHAAAGDPGTAAIDFLEKVRQRKINLEPGGDTALSAQTAVEKKARIARRLDLLARDLGSEPLEVGAVREDEGFAGVLVKKAGGFDPSHMRVFPVALVKKETGWLAAPLPASFENIGAGYSVPLRKRLVQLEDWMLREQVTDLQTLREESLAKMREKISARFPLKKLQAMGARDAGEEFVAACAGKDLPTLLGLLGGLGEVLPDDWTARLKAAERAVNAGSQAIRPWQLLISPGILRVTVHTEEDEKTGMVCIACLDPAGKPRNGDGRGIELITLDLAKTADGTWRVNPAPWFFADTDDSEDEGTDLEEDLTQEFIGRFAGKWRSSHPPRFAPDAGTAHRDWLEATKDADAVRLMALADLGGKPADSIAACVYAARMWWSIRDPGTVSQPLPLAFKEDGDSAVGLIQIFSARNPDHYNPHAVYYQKAPDGWQWTPVPHESGEQRFHTWVEAETKAWTAKWQREFVKDVPVIEKGDVLVAPSAEVARECVEKWRAAIDLGDISGALSNIALLDDQRSSFTALQNIGYEIIGARRNNRSFDIAGTFEGKFWTAVGAKSRQDGKTDYPMYSVVQTPDGPRVLVEIDMIASRNREFLNKTAMERLRKATDSDLAKDLQALFERHQKEAAAADVPAEGK